MSASGFVKLTDDQVNEMAVDLMRRLAPPEARDPQKRFLIVCGGSPGVGKSTASLALSRLARTFHVQANSARYLLGKQGFQWGGNVRLVISEVVKHLLMRGFPVLLDGMATEEADRQMLKNLAREHGARTFFFAVMCKPGIAEARAKVRYADGKTSSFADWRASPDKVVQYMSDITTRAILLKEMLRDVPDDQTDGVWRVDNSFDQRHLVQLLETYHLHIKRKF